MTLQYGAILTLLATQDYASEAESLLRSLIEGLARVAWIHEGIGAPAGDQRDARCRALCLELGIAVQRKREVVNGFMVDEQDRRAFADLIEAGLQYVTPLHSTAGCARPWLSFQVERIVREMAQDQGSGMVHDPWIFGSGAAHNFLPTRLYRQNPDGTTQVGAPIRYGLRAFMLRMTVDVLREAGQRMLAVHGASQDAVDRLLLWVANYQETPPLRNALRGELDYALGSPCGDSGAPGVVG